MAKASTPPAQLLETGSKVEVKGKKTVVLGLATVTLMEHSAALLIDGKLVAAIEQERLNRIRHFAWTRKGQPGASLASDPTVLLDEPWPQEAIDTVLKMAGIGRDQVDVVAMNGLPFRFRHSFTRDSIRRPPQVLRSNNVVFVPHHLCHAASAIGLSGLDNSWILTCDGRGDYETVSWWRAEGKDIELLDAVPFYPDASVGGVYETVTRVLGFGTHGQGSTMALAAYGEANVDLSDCMHVDEHGRAQFSEWIANNRFKTIARGRDMALKQEHKDLAASVQQALENAMLRYIETRLDGAALDNLCIAGGVGLNCRMNGQIRSRLAPRAMAVPPGSNDAGTAIGAALIAHRELTGTLPRLDPGHTYFGPAYSDKGIARKLEAMGLGFTIMDDVAEETAALLDQGKVVCWFQGRMEFGPRALGARSILGDPRKAQLKARMNKMKSRQGWRPFGPSILAGKQGDWFVEDWDSRFMLFAVTVRPEKRYKVPVVVHEDGSTRPQVVHRKYNPRYHDMIAAFERRTGVPMVINTSFNQGGEPIVQTPVQAIKSFAKMGGDALVLGNCLLRREGLQRRRRR